MDALNLKDVETILAYVTDRNPQAATTLNDMLITRIRELVGDSADFPSIGVMLTNDKTTVIGMDPSDPATDYLLYFSIVDIGPDNVATSVNTFYIVNTADGTVTDHTAGLTAVN